MEFIFLHSWFILIISIFFNTIFNRFRVKDTISENPELAKGYNVFFLLYFILTSIPFVIIGIGCKYQIINSLFDIFSSNYSNPIILLFYSYIVIGVIVFGVWIYFMNGADFVDKHPGVLRGKYSIITGKSIKQQYPFIILIVILGVVYQYFGDFLLDFFSKFTK